MSFKMLNISRRRISILLLLVWFGGLILYQQYMSVPTMTMKNVDEENDENSKTSLFVSNPTLNDETDVHFLENKDGKAVDNLKNEDSLGDIWGTEKEKQMSLERGEEEEREKEMENNGRRNDEDEDEESEKADNTNDKEKDGEKENEDEEREDEQNDDKEDSNDDDDVDDENKQDSDDGAANSNDVDKSNNGVDNDNIDYDNDDDDDDDDDLDEDGWRHLTIHEAFARFESQMGEECVKRSEKLICPPARLEKREKGEVIVKGCKTFVNIDELKFATSNAKPGSMKPLYGDKEYILPFEKRRLKDLPLKNPRLLPDAPRSRLVILSPPTSSSIIECAIGEKIEMRLDLLDYYGKRRTKGDDDVRVWTTQGDPTTGNAFSAMGRVVDNNNGSYFITVSCLWPGETMLKVAVVYPREYLRMTTNQHRVHTGRYVGMLFTKKGSNEGSNVTSITACAATPLLPYSCLCNFTSWNKQSFFCGHPVHPKLTCDNAVGIRPLWFSEPENATETEWELNKNMTRKSPGTLVEHGYKIRAKGGSLSKPPPCNEMPFRRTWTHSYPKGYYTPGGEWKSLLCNNYMHFSAAKQKKCLRDFRIGIIGDSNGIRLARAVSNQTLPARCRYHWPKHVVCFNNDSNIRIDFYPHEYPLFLHNTIWNEVESHGGIAHVIDSLPSKGKILIFVHYFMHMSPFHMSTFRARLEALRDAIARVVDRNPQAYFAYRSPHAMYQQWDNNHSAGGDVLIKDYLDVIQEIFRPVWDHVIFLDGLEKGTLLENLIVHPIDYIPDEMVRLAFNLVCDRQIER